MTSIYAIGHSTRPLDKFIEILLAHQMTLLADIRTVPRSRHNPQFSRESLEVELPKTEIKYRHMPALGGLRHASNDSINLGWENASFRGFADYMQTPEFADGIEKVITLSEKESLAMMCA